MAKLTMNFLLLTNRKGCFECFCMFLFFFFLLHFNVCLSGFSRKPGYIVFSWKMHLSLPKTISTVLNGSELRPPCGELTENRPSLKGLTLGGLTHGAEPSTTLCSSGSRRGDVWEKQREETECASIGNGCCWRTLVGEDVLLGPG